MTEVVVFVGAIGFLAVAAWRIWWKPAKLNAVVEVNQPTSVFVLVRHWSRHCYGIISPPMRSMHYEKAPLLQKVAIVMDAASAPLRCAGASLRS
jgi:hypothetical protein